MVTRVARLCEDKQVQIASNGRTWRCDQRLGDPGGSGKAYEVTGENGSTAAMKVVPVSDSTEREALIGDLLEV